MDDDPNILDLDYVTFNRIRNVLENPSSRSSLLEVLDPEYFNTDFLLDMDIEGQKSNMTPAKYLLLHMGSYGIRVSHLCSLFEKINLQRPLMYLKREEPIVIIEQPPQNLKVHEGREVRLVCKANSFPYPEYHWFKGDEELLLESDSVLLISCAKSEDSGIYCCQVIKFNPSTNQYVWLNSDPSEVEIISKDIPRQLSYKELEPDVEEHAAKILCIDNYLDGSSAEKKESIQIEKQPFVDGRVHQGMSICLICEAKSTFPIKYQWFQNGRPLPEETSSSLVLNYLYPDPFSGDTEWEYKCFVYNEYDHLFSRTVTVKLADANENTRYFAAGKKAFMVANDTYSTLEDLKKPAADVAVLAHLLSSLNFQIFAFKNLNLTEMKNAFHIFCKMLNPNDYALFFFAGHGFEIYGQTYLQPVDCSDACLQHESICSEYILQCMQEQRPAMNVLLIDACRNLPPKFGETSSEIVQPGKVFNAKMKNNTIYGYSTSFLYSSHESDSEPNSVFVKYLQRYITKNKKIQDVLIDVQRDFESDIATKGLQFPMVKSTLTAYRKLCDPIQSPLHSDNCSIFLKWSNINRENMYRIFDFSDIGVTIILEFQHHMKVFCNGMDINTYFDIKVGALIDVLLDMEVDVSFHSKEIKVFPVSGCHLKNVVLNIGEKNLVLKKHVLDLHKIKAQNLEGKILLKFCRVGTQEAVPFSVNISEIARLELSVNQLKSYNIEKHQHNSNFKNCGSDESVTLHNCPVTEELKDIQK